MSPFPGVWSQRGWGAADIDDCWVVATLWCAGVSLGLERSRMPSITEFRVAADDPDDGVNDGGNIGEIILACGRLWPHLPVVRTVTASSERIRGFLARGRTISLAVHSGYLPVRLQHGFTGLHQISVAREPGAWLVMNPLAPEGADLARVGDGSSDEIGLLNAARRFGDGYLIGALFPEEGPFTVALPTTLPDAGKALTAIVRIPGGTRAIEVDTRVDHRFPGDKSRTWTREGYAVRLGPKEGLAARGFLVKLDDSTHFVFERDVEWRAATTPAPDCSTAIETEVARALAAAEERAVAAVKEAI